MVGVGDASAELRVRQDIRLATEFTLCATVNLRYARGRALCTSTSLRRSAAQNLRYARQRMLPQASTLLRYAQSSTQ